MLQKRSALRAALVLWACASAAGVARSGRAEPGNEGALTSGKQLSMCPQILCLLPSSRLCLSARPPLPRVRSGGSQGSAH